jgi:hypothetical protein
MPTNCNQNSKKIKIIPNEIYTHETTENKNVQMITEEIPYYRISENGGINATFS